MHAVEIVFVGVMREGSDKWEVNVHHVERCLSGDGTYRIKDIYMIEKKSCR